MTSLQTGLDPFSSADSAGWRAWRDAKLAAAPGGVGDLVVEVKDIESLSAAEHTAMMDRILRANMAVYIERHPRPGRDDKAALRTLCGRFGLSSLDHNQLADDDGVTPLAVHSDGPRAGYIPFSPRPIAWHTDGYYNHPPRRVRALCLHCARPAAKGGENRLMDAEMLFLLLKEEDPGHIDALMRDDAMTIPGNTEEGMKREATIGPVFWIDAVGALAMRYTARARNVVWSGDEGVTRAVAAIRHLLDGGSPHVFQGRLEPGWGLISNNVLHTREPFTDDPAAPRLLYRARWHDRIAGS